MGIGKTTKEKIDLLMDELIEKISSRRAMLSDDHAGAICLIDGTALILEEYIRDLDEIKNEMMK